MSNIFKKNYILKTITLIFLSLVLFTSFVPIITNARNGLPIESSTEGPNAALFPYDSPTDIWDSPYSGIPQNPGPSSIPGIPGPIEPSSSSSSVECSIINPFNPMGCVAQILYHLLLKPASWVLWFAGTVFNLTLNFTLNFGTIINDKSFGLGSETGAIYIGWSTIRNFINVAFIFVLLYTSIAIILRIDKYNAQEIITKVVIAALLLNFSLFFTKAIIDLSNILALQFYSRIIEASNRASGQPSTGIASIDGGISAGYLNALGLKTIWGGSASSKDISTPENLGFGPYQLIMVSIFGSIFMIIFAFVLLMATVQFLIRSVLLIILMLTSVVGFTQGAIPGLENASKDWWAKLKETAIFAPAYMALLYMVSSIVFGVDNSKFTGGMGFVDIINGNSGALGIVFWYLLVIGLLLSSQIIAGKFAGTFGEGYTNKARDYIKNSGKWLGKKYWKATSGAVVTAGRRINRGYLATDPVGAKKRLELIKEDNKNRRQGRNESDVDFKIRKNKIEGRAIVNLGKTMGLDESSYNIVDGKHTLKNTDLPENKALKDKIEEYERKSRRKIFGRKEALDRMSSFKKNFTSNSTQDKESEEKKIKEKIKNFPIFDGTQYEAGIKKLERELTKFKVDKKVQIDESEVAVLTLKTILETNIEAKKTEFKKAKIENEAKRDKLENELKKLRAEIKQQLERTENRKGTTETTGDKKSGTTETTGDKKSGTKK